MVKKEYKLAEKINKKAFGKKYKESSYMKNLRADAAKKQKESDKEYKKFSKERKARYKKEGISGL